MRTRLILFTTLAFLVGCVNNAPTPNPITDAEAKSLTWKEKTAKANYCAGDTTRCVKYENTYVIFEGDSIVARKLNAEIDSFATFLLAGEGRQPLSADSLGQLLCNDYKEMMTDPSYQMPWEVEIKTQVLFNTTRFLTLDRNAYTYLGGAHPNAYRVIASYDLATGRTLTASDFIVDHAGVAKMLEVKYKQDKGADPKSNLKDLTFDGSPLPMPANMAIVEDGILFFYNTFEVASYAVGSTEITLTWQELGAMAKKW